MAYLTGYFDESGKFKEHEIVAFAGFLADEYAWSRLQASWAVLLEQDGIYELHAKKAFRFAHPLSSRRAAKGIDERARVLSRYVKAIHETVEYGAACAVDVRAFRQLDSQQQKKLKNPHYTAFLFVLGLLYEHTNGRGVTISLMCDDEESYSVECYRLFTTVRRSEPEMRKRFISIGFGDDHYFPQLQAADLCVGLLRRNAESRFLSKPDPFAVLFDQLSHPKGPNRFEMDGYFMGIEAAASSP